MNIEKLTLGAMQTNCYILSDEKSGECAVIDPAAEAGEIIGYVRKNSLKIKYIILTHVHIDHIMALDELKKLCGAPVAVHEEEARLLNDNMGTLAQLFGTAPPASKADILLHDGDNLNLGDEVLKIIHTPGHTIGGISILCGKILISGDALLNMSIGRTDFPGGSYNQLKSSIVNKLFVLDDDTLVYPGHGEITTIGNEKSFNPFLG